MTTPRRIQEDQYDFPYHWIADGEAGYWRTSRSVPGAFAYLALMEEVEREVLATAPRSVMDFGCGDGRLAHALARRVPEVTGIDLSERAIAFARAFARPDGLRFECGPVEDSPRRRYDVVVAMEVLEHIPSDALPSAVDALHERVEADGRLVVTVPTKNVPLSPKHERHYTADLLDEHVGARFTRLSVRYVNRVSRLATALDRVAANRYFALRHPAALRLVTNAYRSRAVRATHADGANLLAVYRPSS